MRKLLLAAVSAAALFGGSTAASATTLVFSSGTTTGVTPPASAIFGNTFGSATSPVSAGNFNDTFSFTLSSMANTDASLVTFLLNGVQNINFGCATCSIYLDTNDAAHAFVQTGTSPETWALLNPVSLTSGITHTLYVNGTISSGPTAAYSGTINFQTPRAVPEPATWAMMLLGFAGIGMAFRRRRTPTLAQIA